MAYYIPGIRATGHYYTADDDIMRDICLRPAGGWRDMAATNIREARAPRRIDNASSLLIL